MSPGSSTLAEIGSQPEVWAAAAAAAPAAGHLLAAPGERLLVLGCGTSAFVAASLAALREAAGLGETDWAYASEIPTARRYDRVVALTRSGTTTEVLEALHHFSGTRRVAVTGVHDSPVEDVADDLLVLDFADETSVVQTRFPTATLVLARAAFGDDVSGLPAAAQQALDAELPVDPHGIDHVVYLGRGWTLGLAHEAALKIREAAQAHAESYPALDYRHGPIAMAGTTSLVWGFGPMPDDLLADVASTGAVVVSSSADPLAQLVLAQRFAVAKAQSEGLDPDRPRNLTRSVILSNGAGSALPSPRTSSSTRSEGAHR
jgi:glutamine---fructose-6-phosphate transaminase (isomerizing)